MVPLFAALTATLVIFPPSTSEKADSYVATDLISALDTVWRIRLEMFGEGSGIAVANYLQINGSDHTKTRFRVLILTANHVAAVAEQLPFEIEITAEFNGTILRNGRVVSIHPNEDAALLEFFSENPVMIVQMTNRVPDLLEDLYSVGYSGRQGERWISKGLYCGEFRTTSQAAPGDSGGAVFDKQGKLVGVMITLDKYRNHQWVFHHLTYSALPNLSEWLAEHLVSGTLYYQEVSEVPEEDQTLQPDHSNSPEDSELPETESDEKTADLHGLLEHELQLTPTLPYGKGF